MIYLVGSGPGDPGLFTLKGVRCMQEADVVVYDRLAPRALLGYAKPEAEKIYVGKKPGNPTMSQGEINDLLVEKGRAGMTVVRLKGGDPMLFGRAQEEIAALDVIIAGAESAILSMQALRTWLAVNPSQCDRVLSFNEVCTASAGIWCRQE